MDYQELTALEGTLVRRKTGWSWSDGEPAPEVRDEQPRWVDQFRCLGPVGGPFVIEVPVRVALENPELKWVLDLMREWKLEEAPPTDFAGPVERLGLPRAFLLDPISGGSWEVLGSQGGDRMIHVPHEVWQERTTVGPRWDAKDERAILKRAQALGWSGG